MGANNDTNAITLKINFKWVTLLLGLVITGMLALWRPWTGTVPGRTVSATGKAVVKAEPDEFAFNPSYEFKNADKNEAMEQTKAKSNEVVEGLKKLGVVDKDIKTNLNDMYSNYYRQADSQFIYTVTVQAVAHSRDEAQKVQNYLTTTGPGGQVTPYPRFSQELAKKLEENARTKATADARSQVDKMAQNLGFRVGKIKNISDGVAPMIENHAMQGTTMAAADPMAAGSALPVQPGQNDFNYSVSVTYYIR
ncbi:SIMPL domain-containing protein [Candidatus Saccharibacteria bacterium]|nr:SIMPL domain-containing protein [Candidatus Saccharibacteria bacterium]